MSQELRSEICACSEQHCTCDNYASPLLCEFTPSGIHAQTVLHEIRQRKGEAECGQVDWVIHFSKLVNEGEAIASLVSSADIDAVVLHMFAVALHMPRKDNSDFKNEVFVILRKPGWQDVYHIASIIRTLEMAFGTLDISPKVAMTLCLAGNDFLPKFHGITHFTVLRQVCQNRHFQEHLFNLNLGMVDGKTLLDFLKHLYCPSSLNPEKLSYEEVRQMTIKPPHTARNKKKGAGTLSFMFVDGQTDVKQPNKWLVPADCAKKLVSLYNAMLQNLAGLGQHDAPLPNFQDTCLTSKDQYDFGPQSRVQKLQDLLEIPEEEVTKKKAAFSRKRMLEFSPRKFSKHHPKTSTPHKQ